MNKKNCTCRICSRARKFFEITAKLDRDDRYFILKCLSELDHAENDAEYWKLVAQGIWPTCKEFGPLINQRKQIHN